MLRLMGAVLLTAGAAALGCGAAGRLAGRVRDLSALEAGLAALRRELGWRLAPLPEALERAARCSGGRAEGFFRRCAAGAAAPDGRAFGQVWREAARSCALRLEDGDLEALDALGGVLGRYDGDSQRQALEEAGERLRARRTAAEERRDRLGRVYRALGVAGGLVLAILLI